jgi:biopolymer transport protein TolQ
MFLFHSSVIASVNPLKQAISNSDGVGIAVVILLSIGSIFTWFIMVEKGYTLYKARKASESFIIQFREKAKLLASYREAGNSISPVARIYEIGSDQSMTFYGIPPEKADFYGTQIPLKKLTTAELETIHSNMEREVSDQILELEDKIGLLATAVSVSPFLGLFGTVWGIMSAFCGIALEGQANISALAPGVSGALLTTVVGLLVAIPSLIGYNLLTITIRKITVYMDNFVEEFMARVKLEQLEVEDNN